MKVYPCYGENYAYTRKKADEETGLVYFGARFYDPEIGRFITEDPAKDGVNWYVYCENNPLKYIDLDGLSSIGITVQGGACCVAAGHGGIMCITKLPKLHFLVKLT
ncbi:MAG: RHS repeat domain-containing protein [Bacillota bacterium]